MRYIFAHALRGRGSRARCRPRGRHRGRRRGRQGNGIVAERPLPADRRGRICGGRAFPAGGRHERSAGRRTARQKGIPGAFRNPGHGGIQGAGSAKEPARAALRQKNDGGTSHAGNNTRRRNNKARIFLKRRGLFCTFGAGPAVNTPVGENISVRSFAESQPRPTVNTPVGIVE